MQFIDKAKISVKAGKGGDGIVSFRKEAYVPKGGPAGGDGGKGGSVIFEATTHLSTLLDLRYNRLYKAKSGENGMPKRMHGADAKDLIVRVPIGTVIYDVKTGRVMADLVSDKQRAVIAKGGRGGRGNCRFATSRNPAPQICERGEPGEDFEVICELKLLADVGLVGFPSVGKSTLLSVVSRAKPEIADYHFTTIVPNLGVVQAPDGRSFVMADLPGLIEGASQGKGLGHQFLRHIERCRVIVHIVDMGASEGRDPYEDYCIINKELAAYEYHLMDRPQIILANKMDLPGAEENLARFKSLVDAPVYPISAYMAEGLKEPLYKVADLLDRYTETVVFEDVQDQQVLYRYDGKEERGYEVHNEGNGLYVLTGKKIERLVQMTSFSSDDALKRFALKLRNMGIDDALRKAGAKNGDTVRILDFEFEFND
jgi:Obg family GTPase CgtA